MLEMKPGCTMMWQSLQLNSSLGHPMAAAGRRAGQAGCLIILGSKGLTCSNTPKPIFEATAGKLLHLTVILASSKILWNSLVTELAPAGIQCFCRAGQLRFELQNSTVKLLAHHLWHAPGGATPVWTP